MVAMLIRQEGRKIIDRYKMMLFAAVFVVVVLFHLLPVFGDDQQINHFTVRRGDSFQNPYRHHMFAKSVVVKNIGSFFHVVVLLLERISDHHLDRRTFVNLGIDKRKCRFRRLSFCCPQENRRLTRIQNWYHRPIIPMSRNGRRTGPGQL